MSTFGGIAAEVEIVEKFTAVNFFGYFSHFYGNLVSENEDVMQYNGPNVGISLPEEGATHNASLSPFFLNKAGFNFAWDNTKKWVSGINSRAQSGYLWSSNVATDNAISCLGNSRYGSPSVPSGRVFGQSLRCLVSTY